MMWRIFRMARERWRNLCLSRRCFRPDRFSRQPVDPRSIAGVAARDWERRAAHCGHANMFVHSRDAWTSVVPWAFALSAATVLVLLFTPWMGRALVYGHRVGSPNEIRLKMMSVALSAR